MPPATLARVLRARDRMIAAPTETPPLELLAREVGLSRAYFLRSFADLVGTTPHDYLMRLRLEQAKRSLARGESVTEACLAAGYASLGSFGRLFTRATGLAPRAWQRQIRTVVPSVELWPAVWIPACFLVAHTPSTFGRAALG